jgi:hypothetical protein
MLTFYASGQRQSGGGEPEDWARVSVLLAYNEILEFVDLRRRAKKIMTDRNSIDCSCLFIDSGAFAMRRLSWKYAKESGHSWRRFYDTATFWNYADSYIEFIKKYRDGIDLYANIDVIPDPRLTRRNQDYLEAAGLEPVPVVHFGTSMSWLLHYIECDYDPIGIGGLVAKGGFGTAPRAKAWLDEVFNIVCDTDDRLPRVRIHGFGLAGPLAFKYPFWSTDSTSWVMVGGFGDILMPSERGGKFHFDANPLQLTVSNESPMIRKGKGFHFENLTQKEKALCLRWLDHIGIQYGKGPKEDPDPAGVSNSRSLRIRATLLYYEYLRKSVPEYPWPFERKKIRRTLGVV